jgi:hypothetical protein
MEAQKLKTYRGFARWTQSQKVILFIDLAVAEGEGLKTNLLWADTVRSYTRLYA